MKHPLNEQFRRMQKLAGIQLNESVDKALKKYRRMLNESTSKSLVQDIDKIIDEKDSDDIFTYAIAKLISEKTHAFLKSQNFKLTEIKEEEDRSGSSGRFTFTDISEWAYVTVEYTDKTVEFRGEEVFERTGGDETYSEDPIGGGQFKYEKESYFFNDNTLEEKIDEMIEEFKDIPTSESTDIEKSVNEALRKYRKNK